MGRRNTKNKHKSNIKEQDINTILLKNRVFRRVNYRKIRFLFSCRTQTTFENYGQKTSKNKK